MTTHNFSTIDEYLGERASRFFGQGYKNTDLIVRDVSIDTYARRLAAKLDIQIFGGWSSHQGMERKYHFSNIEALVVAGQVAQCLLYVTENLKREQVENLWIRGLEIRNLRAIETTSDISISALVNDLETLRRPDEVWKHASLQIDIGNAAIRIANYRACFKLKVPIVA